MKQTKEQYWISPGEMYRITGWTRAEAFRHRLNNPDLWKRSPGGGVLYDLNQIPEHYKRSRHEKQH